ncbi:hypothetical protein QEN19_000511 [Hanseniaspora menglaensis]
MKFLVSLDNGKLYNVCLNTARDDDNSEESNKPLVIKDIVLQDKPTSKIIHMDLLHNDLMYMIFANGDILFYEYTVDLQEGITEEYTNYNMITIQDVKHKLHIDLNDEHIMNSHKINRKSKKPIQYNTAAISSIELNKDIILLNDLIKTNHKLIVTTKSGTIFVICLKTFKILFNVQVPAPLSFIKIISEDSNGITVAFGGYENLLKILTIDFSEQNTKSPINTKPMKFNEKLNLPFPNWPIASTKMVVDDVEYYIEITKFGFIKLYNLENSKKPIGGLKDLLLTRPFQKNMQPVLTNVLVENLEQNSKVKLILTDNVNVIWELILSVVNNELIIKQEGKVSRSITGHVTFLNKVDKVNEIPPQFQIIKKEEDENDEEIKPLNKDEITYLASKTNFIKDTELLLFAASNKINIVTKASKKVLADWLLNSKINSVLLYDANDVLSLKKYDKYISRLIRKRGLSVEEEQNEEMWGKLEQDGGRVSKKQKK